MSRTVRIEVGDWVRFMRDNRLVIAQVEYCVATSIGTKLLVTDQGQIDIDSALEIRRRDV